MHKNKNFGGILLAGGTSKRMKSDKASVRLRGKALMDYSLDILDAYCTSAIIVS